MQTPSTDLTLVGFPATILAWLNMFNLININPLLDFAVSMVSLVWLSIQIYGWIEKRIKSYKNARKQERW
jgi:hypothetical protein